MFAGSSILARESDRNALRGVEIQYTRIVNAVESNERARINRARILEVVDIDRPIRQILGSDRQRARIFERAGLELGRHSAHGILAGELHRAAIKTGTAADNRTHLHRTVRLNRAVVADRGLLAVDGQDVAQTHVLGRNVDLDRARGRVVDYGIRSKQKAVHGSQIVRFMVERDVDRAGVAEGRTIEHLDGVVVGSLLVPGGPQVNRDDARFGVVKDTLVSHTDAEHVARRDNVSRATARNVDAARVLELGTLTRRHDCADFGVRSSTRHAVEVKRHVAGIGDVGLCTRVQTVGIALFRCAARHVHRERAGVGGTAVCAIEINAVGCLLVSLDSHIHHAGGVVGEFALLKANGFCAFLQGINRNRYLAVIGKRLIRIEVHPIGIGGLIDHRRICNKRTIPMTRTSDRNRTRILQHGRAVFKTDALDEMHSTVKFDVELAGVFNRSIFTNPNPLSYTVAIDLVSRLSYQVNATALFVD